MTPAAVFDKRQARFQQEEAVAQQRYNRMAANRLAWFVGFALLTIVLFSQGYTNLAMGISLPAIAGFLLLMKRHQVIQHSRDHARWLHFINRDEAARLERRFLRTETGSELSLAEHPYAIDLDIFGNHSLFRLLNRTHTFEGARKLASYLLEPAPTDEILLRQHAVTELCPLLDWRQELEALAYRSTYTGQSPDKLKAWATAPVIPIPTYLLAARWILPLITLSLGGLWLSGILPGWSVTLSLFLHGLLLHRTAEQAKNGSEQTFEIVSALKTYQQLLQHLTERPFQSAILHRLQSYLTHGGHSAPEAIGQLSRLVENLNFRRNPYFSLLVGLFTLWDIHYVAALNRWKDEYSPHLSKWFAALAEAEALNSLAGLAYAHPDYIVPTVYKGEPQLDAIQIRHPLLPIDRNVANSLRLDGQGKTILITGSNMSGKSTFLRTVASNTVLALAGSVVAADRFSCSAVQVFTSMRTQDSLEDNTSSFYAELKRLKALIDRTRQANDRPVLYFLDEILKGTNSADRHRGAKALILQLHKTTASGFISTHDVELGELADIHSFIDNYSFHSDVIDGQLHFDYQLQAGVCRSFNATQLMQSIGIQLDG